MFHPECQSADTIESVKMASRYGLSRKITMKIGKKSVNFNIVDRDGEVSQPSRKRKAHQDSSVQKSSKKKSKVQESSEREDGEQFVQPVILSTQSLRDSNGEDEEEPSELVIKSEPLELEEAQASAEGSLPVGSSLLMPVMACSEFTLVQVKTEPPDEEDAGQLNAESLAFSPDVGAVQQSIVMIQEANLPGAENHLPVMLVNPAEPRSTARKRTRAPAKKRSHAPSRKPVEAAATRPRCTAQSLLRGALNNPLYTCDLCGKHFTSESAWQRHALNHNAASNETTWACGICGVAFPSEKFLLEHDQECSSGRNCFFCGEHFSNDDERLEHVILNHPEVSVLKETDDDLYKCGTCLRNYNSPQTLLNHLQSHMGDRPYKCTVCDKAFRQTGDVTRHMRTHTDDRPYKCKLCPKSFRTSGNLQEHCRIHTGVKPFQCRVCGRQFARSTGLTVHMRSHSGVRPFQCKECGQRFTQAGGLLHHQSTHTKKRPFECEVCGKSFSWKYHLDSHRMIHSGEKPYECEICHKRFRQSSTRQKHMRLHTTPKTFSCQICYQSFTDLATCQEHMRSHSMEKPFKCQMCSADFTLKTSYQIHLKSVHAIDKPFICSLCGKGFSQEVGLQQHRCSPKGSLSRQSGGVAGETSGSVGMVDSLEQDSSEDEVPSLVNIKAEPMSPGDNQLESMPMNNPSQVPSVVGTEGNHSAVLKALLTRDAAVPSTSQTRAHTLPHPAQQWSQPNKLSCHICHKGFTHERHMSKHMEIHNPSRPHACSVCQKRFHHPADVARHMRIHTDEKPYECEVCLKRFRTSGNRNEHKRIHSKVKVRPYPCSICKKGFMTSSSLNNHMDIHSGKRPHMCNLCGRRFRQLADLQRHIRIHTDDRPYECNVCDSKFKTSGNLHDHMKIHLGSKPHVCHLCGTAFRQSSTLKKHMRIHPNKDKQFSCSMCQRKFNWTENLDIHMRRMHNVKSHTCPRCSMSFGQEFSLRAHMDSRSCEQKRCPDCGKCFALEMKLRHHICRPNGPGQPVKRKRPPAAEEPAAKSRKEEKTLNVFDLLKNLVNDDGEDRKEGSEARRGSQDALTSPSEDSSVKMSESEQGDDDGYHVERLPPPTVKDDVGVIVQNPDPNQRVYVLLEKLSDEYVEYRTSQVQHRSISIEELAKIYPPVSPFGSTSSSDSDPNALDLAVASGEPSTSAGLNPPGSDRQIKLEPVSPSELVLEPVVTFQSLLGKNSTTGKKSRKVATKSTTAAAAVAVARKKVSPGIPAQPEPSPFSPGLFKCTDCSESFMAASELIQHWVSHTKEGETQAPLQCTFCAKSFPSASSLASHMEIHSGDRPYDCTVCRKSFRQAGDVVRHMRVHTGEKPYECSICLKRFRNSGNLQEHNRIHTGYKPHECADCGRCFNRGTALLIHQRVHKGAKAHKCTMCYQSFAKASGLREHMKVHNKSRPYKCEICGKQFGYSYHLQGHMMIHTGDKPHKCDLCGKSFRQTSTLTKHLRVHSGERPYSCRYCTKRYSNRPALELHESYHEKGTKEYMCQLCKEVFFRASDLTQHHCRVTSEAPCNCQLCGAVFTRSRDLEKHVCSNIQEASNTMSGASSSAAGAASPSEDFCRNVLESLNSSATDECATFVVPQIKEEPLCSIGNVWSYASDASATPAAVDSTPASSSVRSLLGRPGLLTPGSLGEHRKCSVCKGIFESVNILALHMNREHGSHTPQCHVCATTFQSSLSIRKHMLKKHSGEEWMQCTGCMCYFHSPSEQLNHRCPGADGSLRKCLCGQEIRGAESIVSHWESHADFDIQQCLLCSQLFFSHHVLLRHLKSHMTREAVRPKGKASPAEKSAKSRVSPPSVGVVLPQNQEDVAPDALNSAPLTSSSEQSGKDTFIPPMTPATRTARRSSAGASLARILQAPNTPTSSEQAEESFPEVAAEVKVYKCCACKSTVHTQQALEVHYERVHSSSNECLLCRKKCPQRKSLRKHAELHRDGQMPTCPVCRKSFSKERELRAHWSGTSCPASKEETFSCICEATFSTVKEFQEHMLDHADDVIHACRICEKKFQLRRSLKKHIHQKHALPQCGKCHKVLEHGKDLHVCVNPKKLSSKSRMKNTLALLSSSGPAPNAGSASQYSCSICLQTFERAIDLQLHRCPSMPAPPNQCLSCGKCFSSARKLKAHQAKCGAQDQTSTQTLLPFVCGKCGKGFADISKLHIHSYECPGDGKTPAPSAPPRPKTSQSLQAVAPRSKSARARSPVSSVAEADGAVPSTSGGGKKPLLYECPSCDKKFKSVFLMNQHIPNHFQSQFYNCQLCGRDYQHRSTVMRHLRRSHPEVRDIRAMVERCRIMKADPEVKMEPVDPEYEESLEALGDAAAVVDPFEAEAAVIDFEQAEVAEGEECSESDEDAEPRLVIAEVHSMPHPESPSMDGEAGLVIAAVVGGCESQALFGAHVQADEGSGLVVASVVGARHQPESPERSELVITQVVGGSSSLEETNAGQGEDENETGLVIAAVTGGSPDGRSGFVISEVRGGFDCEPGLMEEATEPSPFDSMDGNKSQDARYLQVTDESSWSERSPSVSGNPEATGTNSQDNSGTASAADSNPGEERRPGPSRRAPQRAKIFKCSICHKKFSQRSSLDQHKRAHRKRYQCQECGQKFNFCSSLQDHVLSSHSTNAPLFTCPKCNVSFKQLTQFQQHLCSGAGQ